MLNQVLVTSTLLGAVVQAQTKPNFVIIMSDDAGYQDFGFQGSKEFKTPNLDKLAEKSVQFTRAYAGPTCSPSRCAMLTGRYQQRSGFGRNCGARFNEPNDGLPIAVKTLPMDLKKLGYKTGLIGKWHQGANAGVNQPLDVGFDEFWGLLGGSRSYFGNCRGAQAMWRNRLPDPNWINQKSIIPPDPKRGRYITDAIGDESVNYIKKHAKDPFFLFVSFTSPHTPIQAKTQDLAQFPNLKGVRKKQAAMQLAEDRAIGRLMVTLDENKLTDNTYVVFLNDNGGSSHSGLNGQLRDFKGSVYEGGIRVPMLLSGPKLKAGQFKHAVSHMDLLPTFVKLAGGELERSVDGKNLIPHLGDNSAVHKALFFRHTGAGVSVSTDHWKLINPKNPGEHKKYKPGHWELYNLTDDIGEKNDLSSQFPEKVIELKQLIAKWEATLPKNRWGQFGKQDRNYGNQFTWVKAGNGNFSDQQAWQGEDSKKCRLSCQEMNPDSKFIFNGESVVNNDLYSASGLAGMVNRIVVDGTTTFTGQKLRLVPSLARIQPQIKVSGSAIFDLPLLMEGNVTIVGLGTVTLNSKCQGESLNFNCKQAEITTSLDVDKVSFSPNKLVVTKPIKIDGEVVISPTCQLVVDASFNKDSVIKAKNILGKFANNHVTLGNKKYKIIYDIMKITLKEISNE